MKKILKNVLFMSVPMIIVLALVEVIVRLLNIPALQDEPYFFGFSGCPEYFQEVNSETKEDVYRTNLQKNIEKTSFNITKSDNTFRVFTLGGSCTYGEPYGPDGAFSHWLKARLSTMYPEMNFEMINCGRQGFGSIRVRNIFDEIVNYDPDLIVVYFGNNEIRDNHFHHSEINIEIRPLFKTIKRVLDNSYIFRMIFHLVIKNHTTSYGAEAIKNIINNGSFNNNVFSSRIEYLNSRRKILDKKHGGLWVPHLDSLSLSEFDKLDKNVADLVRVNVWHEKIKNVFKMNIRHIGQKCKTKNVPIIFLTLVRNFYYNRDAIILFEKFSDANNVLREVCTEEKIPLIETLPALLKSYQGNIGFNSFVDSGHPTLLTNQIIAKEITNKLFKLKLIPDIDSLKYKALANKIASQEKIDRENFLLNSQYYSLIGWQELICMNASTDRKATQTEIISLANKALELDPGNEKAYLLLGALYTYLKDYENVKIVWEKIKLQYNNFSVK